MEVYIAEKAFPGVVKGEGKAWGWKDVLHFTGERGLQDLGTTGHGLVM